MGSNLGHLGVICPEGHRTGLFRAQEGTSGSRVIHTLGLVPTVLPGLLQGS